MKNLIILTLLMTISFISISYADKKKKSAKNDSLIENIKLSKPKYTRIKLSKEQTEKILKLVKISSSDMLVAITAKGAKIIELDYTVKKQIKNTKNKIKKLTKYEFYSAEYFDLNHNNNKTNGNVVKIEFHIPGGEFCHSYKQGRALKWFPDPPCPL